jgi:hypothetical protein
MHSVYFLIRIYPYWVIPFCILFGQLGIHFRRRHRPVQWFYWGMVVCCLLSSGAWIYLRGDLNSDKWVRTVLELI